MMMYAIECFLAFGEVEFASKIFEPSLLLNETELLKPSIAINMDNKPMSQWLTNDQIGDILSANYEHFYERDHILNAFTLNNRSVILIACGQLGSAQVLLRKAIQICPKFPQIIQNLVYVCIRCNDHQEAASIIRKYCVQITSK
jgi:hypothetical protein